MRKINFVAIVLLWSVAICFAQTKTPTAITTAFSKKFPNATNVMWDKENAHNFEAKFEWKGEKLSANFTDTGEWLETGDSAQIDHLIPLQTDHLKLLA